MLGAETLVLSADYRPISTIPWQRAMVLWATDKVEVLETYTERAIRSVSAGVQFMPAVIRFLRTAVKKKRAVRFSRDAVYNRDSGKCQYCGKTCSRSEFTYDHVVPRKYGGMTTWENVVIACMPCNQKKGGRTPEQARMVLLTKPVKPTRAHDPMFISLKWDKNMPEAWRNWMASREYWHGPLDDDAAGA